MRRITHPGTILYEELLIPLNITPHSLAKAINLSPTKIYDIIKGKQAITVNIAIRFSKFFGTTPQFWLILQMRYDISKELHLNSKDFEKIHQYA